MTKMGRKVPRVHVMGWLTSLPKRLKKGKEVRGGGRMIKAK